MLVPKEFSVEQEEMTGIDWQNEKQIKDFFERTQKKVRAGYEAAPYIREALLGNFLEMLDRGFFDRIYRL